MKVLLAIDGSDASMSAVAATAALPSPPGATVEVVERHPRQLRARRRRLAERHSGGPADRPRADATTMSRAVSSRSATDFAPRSAPSKFACSTADRRP